jgi:hypothetical protein
MNNSRSVENTLRVNGIIKNPLYNDRIDLNNVYSYELLSKLLVPFKDWPAYQCKIIDENGNILISRKHMDRNHLKYFTQFDMIVLKIKKSLEKNNSEMFMNKNLPLHTKTSLLVQESEVPVNVTGPAIAGKDMLLSVSLLSRIKNRKIKKKDKDKEDGRITTSG